MLSKLIVALNHIKEALSIDSSPVVMDSVSRLSSEIDNLKLWLERSKRVKKICRICVDVVVFAYALVTLI